jgi:acyl dehydratase
MIEILPLAVIRERIGRELGKTDWLLIDQQRINTFADCTNDHQWIHVDEKAAAQGPFGKTIAHGFLTVSLLSFFGAEIGLIPTGTAMAINYGMNKLRLLNPVPVGARIRDTIVLTDVTEKPDHRVLMTTTHTVEIEGQEKPGCVAEILTMFFIQH